MAFFVCFATARTPITPSLLRCPIVQWHKMPKARNESTEEQGKNRTGDLETPETLQVEFQSVTWHGTAQSKSLDLRAGLMQLMGNHRRELKTAGRLPVTAHADVVDKRGFVIEFTCCMTKTLNASLLQAVFKLYLKGFIMSLFKLLYNV